MNNLIVNEKTLNQREDNRTCDALNVIYGVDENYQLGAGVSAVSLLINNIDVNFRFHFFLERCSSDFLEKLTEASKKFNTEIIIYKINSESIDNLPKNSTWSSAMYFRLLAFDFLSSKYKSALYLDADIICNGFINLNNDSISVKTCAAVADNEIVRKKSSIRLGVDGLEKTYFNSGVLFVNLQRWKERAITEQCISMLSSIDAKNKYKYPDQDVLNIILRNDISLMAKKYNTIFTLKNELNDKTHKKYLSVITSDTVFIHYTGITKPWNKWANYPSSSPFYKALYMSPWDESYLKPAIRMIELKKEYKHLFKQNKWFSGFLSGTKYSFYKLKNKFS